MKKRIEKREKDKRQTWKESKMSAIITKALSSTLKIFLKDYNKQQLNLKLFGGEATLDSISTITLISFTHFIYILLSSSFLLPFFLTALISTMMMTISLHKISFLSFNTLHLHHTLTNKHSIIIIFWYYFPEIDEKVIHELLHLPPVLEIESIECSNLRIKVTSTYTQSINQMT